jgi:two-component system, chemotaxis family, response regulator Rcp1
VNNIAVPAVRRYHTRTRSRPVARQLPTGMLVSLGSGKLGVNGGGRGGGGMHVLLVEDNPGDARLMREAVAEFIAQGTLHVSTVRDGEHAVPFLRRAAPYTAAVPPDLVLLDLNLPGKSGYEILAELKHDPKLKYIPVVVLTSTANPQEVNRCYELGASAYLVKPMELEQYLSLIKLTVTFWSACKFRILAD